jgi:hypothetical protein
MTQLGRTLFGGSRFVLWALAGPLTLFAVGLPFLIDNWTPKVVAIVVTLIAASLLLLVALAAPQRFRWAGRSTAAIVFGIYVWYAIEEWFVSNHPFRIIEPVSKASPRNALLGLIVIGGPALLYAVLGRFTIQKEEDSPSADSKEEEQE